MATLKITPRTCALCFHIIIILKAKFKLQFLQKQSSENSFKTSLASWLWVGTSRHAIFMKCKLPWMALTSGNVGNCWWAEPVLALLLSLLGLRSRFIFFVCILDWCSAHAHWKFWKIIKCAIEKSKFALKLFNFCSALGMCHANSRNGYYVTINQRSENWIS